MPPPRTGTLLLARIRSSVLGGSTRARTVQPPGERAEGGCRRSAERPMDRSLRFLLRFAHSAADPAREREILFEVEGEPRPATLSVPEAGGRVHPAWILLQGLTVPGRHHAGARRMARALAAAEHLAFVPEVPSWTALRVDPRQAEPTIRAALRFLADRPGVDRGRVGLRAFSVAATWALEVVAGELGHAPLPGSRQAPRAVVGVGGYRDFRRTVQAMVVGEHQWRGRHYRYVPDLSAAGSWAPTCCRGSRVTGMFERRNARWRNGRCTSSPRRRAGTARRPAHGVRRPDPAARQGCAAWRSTGLKTAGRDVRPACSRPGSRASAGGCARGGGPADLSGARSGRAAGRPPDADDPAARPRRHPDPVQRDAPPGRGAATAGPVAML